MAGASGSKRGTARSKDLTVPEAKNVILEAFASGLNIQKAVARAGKSRATYYGYKSDDDAFRAACEKAMAFAKHGSDGVYVSDEPVPDFPQFCEQYLGMKLFPHQLQWFDLLEGRPPRDVHESMVYDQGDPDMLVINTPPGHAKSTTITVAYAVWRIVKDPDVQIVIVSKTQKLARQFLLQIKNRLTHASYRDLWETFGPPAGYDKDAAAWSADMIYVSPDVRGGEAKDPTVQSLGLRGQLYGTRADLIIMDDVVDNSNAHDFAEQIAWLETEVSSRIPDGGKLLIVGTRLAAQDLYSEIRKPKAEDDFVSGEDNWTYFSQPAVLEFDEDPEKWVTLWPRTDSPSGKHVDPDENGLYEKWSGPVLRKRRARMSEARWARVYQQQHVAADTIFRPDVVHDCQTARKPGLIPDDASLGRVGGMSGLHIIAGLDPATTGHTAAVCLGVEPKTGKRFIIDVFNKSGTRPDETRELIKSWSRKYSIAEWRIEKNGFQGFLTQDREIRNDLASLGVLLTEHHTNATNKNDADYGVMGMAALFEQKLMLLPAAVTEATRAMVEQLVTWAPNTPRGHKTDVVMALWFAEKRARELCEQLMPRTSWSEDNWLTRDDRLNRTVINIDELAREMSEGLVA